MMDENGKLFGKVSIIDVGIVFFAILALAGYFVIRSGRPETQATSKTIQISLLLPEVNVRDLNTLQVGDKASVTIRNQSAGLATLKDIKVMPHLITLPIHGQVKSIPDPAESYSKNVVLTFQAEARETANGYAVGGAKVKVGIPLEIETFKYQLKGGTVIDLLST